MRGHIRKHGAGWQIIVELGRDAQGKRKQKAQGGFKKKPDAEKALAKLITKIESGQYFENTDMLLKDYLKKWLKHTEHQVGQGTYEFYKDVSERILIPSLGAYKLSKLNAIQIQEFLDGKLDNKDLSSTTVRHYYNILNIALNQAVTWRIIQYNPCNAVDPPKKNKTNIQTLTMQQVEQLLDYTKNSEFKVMYMPLLLALTCGLRRGEILGLQWNDVDTVNGVIRIRNNVIKVRKGTVTTTPKTDDSVRTVELLPLTTEALKEHHKLQFSNRDDFEEEYIKNNLVCTWPDGHPIRPDYITQTSPKLLRKVNEILKDKFKDKPNELNLLPIIRFHDMRHTHATLLLELGVHPKIVSERLGHSKIDTTLNTYSHVLPSMQKDAVNKLENQFEKDMKKADVVNMLSIEQK